MTVKEWVLAKKCDWCNKWLPFWCFARLENGHLSDRCYWDILK
jgi:hypothetical protein